MAGYPLAWDLRRRGGSRRPSVLGTDDAVLVNGIWCTPPARTACDVVRLTAPIDGLAILDRALASRTCSRDELAAASIEQAGLREVIRLRWLIPRADALAESPMESRMRWRFLDARLPSPTCQIRVGDIADRWHRLDTGWREHRVGAEFEGGIAHLTQAQLRADRARHNWLTEKGWTLLHFTDIDVYCRHAQMVATVRRLLGRPAAGGSDSGSVRSTHRTPASSPIRSMEKGSRAAPVRGGRRRGSQSRSNVNAAPDSGTTAHSSIPATSTWTSSSGIASTTAPIQGASCTESSREDMPPEVAPSRQSNRRTIFVSLAEAKELWIKFVAVWSGVVHDLVRARGRRRGADGLTPAFDPSLPRRWATYTSSTKARRGRFRWVKRRGVP